MKFSNSLKFNAVADWWDEYIAYSALKKYIYQLEKKQGPLLRQLERDIESNEHSALMGGETGPSSTDEYFVPLLDRELQKICKFFEVQLNIVTLEVEELEQLARTKEEESQHVIDDRYLDEDDDDEDEDDETHPSSVYDRSRSRPRPSTSGDHRRAGSEAKASRLAPALGTSVSQSSRIIGHDRRRSMSLTEENVDLEASLASLTQIPEDHALYTSTGNRRSSSASPIRRKLSSFSNVLNIVGPRSVTPTSPQPQNSIWTANTSYAIDTRILFKRRIAIEYTRITSLKAYVELNHVGFRKILKKYDKILGSNLKERYLPGFVDRAFPFSQEAKRRVNDLIDRLIAMYTKCVTRGDRSAAVRQLKVHQREHIAWERDTVWRRMISQERRGYGNADVKSLGGFIEEEESALEIPTPVGGFRLTVKKVFLAIAIAIFAILLDVPQMPTIEASNCFAILVFCTILWATEAIPLYVTSILVPFLLVIFRVFISTDGSYTRLDASDATKFIFSQMFSPTIMLLIGGFTIASAISKTNIDRVLVTRLLSLAGTNPNVVLLAFMCVSCFASMWISNVAAPTLCFTLIKPILRNLPPKSSFAPCLILGIALAANIGGQSSPISSPQNLIALNEMDEPLDWSQWFMVSLPVSAVSIVLIWTMLLISYRPSRTVDYEELEIKPISANKQKFTLEQYWVSFVCVVTIGLWCVEKKIEGAVGDMGIIAIIPIVVFFSTGVLRKDDFEQFLWTIVFLAMGGIALGKGVSNSGLLSILGEDIRDVVGRLSLNSVVITLTFVVLVVSTFISHTVASVLLVPIAKEVGEKLPGGHQRLLIFLTALVCSTGMGMPVSGFPNQTAATQEDDLGQLYLSNVDFLVNGVPASIIAAIVVTTVGYGLMLAIGL